MISHSIYGYFVLVTTSEENELNVSVLTTKFANLNVDINHYGKYNFVSYQNNYKSN